MSTNRSAEADKLFQAPECKLINGKVVKISDVKVHEFNIVDVEDPDLYAARPLLDWQQSEAGKWVMEHAVKTPFWHRPVNPNRYNPNSNGSIYGCTYYIIARLQEQDQTYWALKWSGLSK
jgi:hypothetical protein